MGLGKVLVGGVAIVAVGAGVVVAAAVGAVWLIGTCMKAWSEFVFGGQDTGSG